VPEISRSAETKLCAVVGNITIVKEAAERNVFNIKFRRKRSSQEYHFRQYDLFITF